MPAPACARERDVVGASGRSVEVELRAAQGDRPFAVAVRVDPADRTGVAAAIERLEPADDLESRHPSASPRPPRSGAARPTRSSADAPSAQLALDVGREVEDVRQLERERLLARGAARSCAGAARRARSAPRRGARPDPSRCREGEGCRGVGVRVGSARRRAGQHARGDRAARDGHERLGARADDAVDRECPAVGVAGRQGADEPAQVRARRHGCRRGRARARPCSPRRPRSRRGRRGRRPGSRWGRAHRGRASPTSRARTRCGLGSVAASGADVRAQRCGSSRIGRRGGRRSTAGTMRVLGAADRRIEGERAEGDESGAGQAHRVVDVGGRGERAPAFGGRGARGVRCSARTVTRRTRRSHRRGELQKRRVRSGVGVGQHVRRPSSTSRVVTTRRPRAGAARADRSRASSVGRSPPAQADIN